MSSEEIEMAKKAMDKFDSIRSFQAKQTVSAGQLSIQARVKFRKPRALSLDYISYQDPYEEFAKEYSGGAEYLGDELEKCHFIYDGRYTFLHDRDRNTALKRKGKDLQDPFGEMDVFGQLGFLKDLTGDYLLKNKGRGEINGEEVYRLGLKPKASRRSLFLKSEVFDFDRAVMALSTESGFPLKITYYPKESSSIGAEEGMDRQIVSEYSDVRFNEAKENAFKFDKERVERFFVTDLVSRDRFDEKVDFPIDLSPAEEKGFRSLGDKLSITESEDGEKFYASVDLLRYDKSREEPPDYLMLRFGNYLSREMSRHRSYVTGSGEPLELGEGEATIVDRGEALKEKMPEELRQPTFEIGWEGEGRFCYILSRGEEKENFVSLAEKILF